MDYNYITEVINGGIQMNKTIAVTKDNYFEDTGHMSVSRFKRFNKCELDGVLNPKFNSSALLMGSYIDSFVEGTLDKFKEEHPELISSRGVTKGSLKAEFSQADEICEFIEKDKTIQQFLSGSKQEVMVGEISGVPFKIMMDSYSKGIAISDLKVMRSITNRDGGYYDFVTAWGYNYQLACYQNVVFQKTGELLPCFIVVVTKEMPINSAIIQIDQSTLDVALYEVEQNIERFYDIMQGTVEPVGCGICSSCIAQRVDTPIISMMDLQNNS